MDDHCRQALEGFALMNRINEIRACTLKRIGGYSKAIFPMVNLDQQVNIEWLIGLRLFGKYDKYFVSQLCSKPNLR